MKKENVIYGILAGICGIFVIGAIGWVAVQEVQKGKDQYDQEVAQKQQPHRNSEIQSGENPNSQSMVADVQSVEGADQALEEMDRLVSELDSGEEISE